MAFFLNLMAVTQRVGTRENYINDGFINEEINYSVTAEMGSNALNILNNSLSSKSEEIRLKAAIAILNLA